MPGVKCPTKRKTTGNCVLTFAREKHVDRDSDELGYLLAEILKIKNKKIGGPRDQSGRRGLGE